jgi:hypothetical protein
MLIGAPRPRCAFCSRAASRRGLCWTHYRKLRETSDFPARMKTGPKECLESLRAWASSFTPDERAVLQAVLVAASMSNSERQSFRDAFNEAVKAA